MKTWRKWIPDRKVWTGGLLMVISFVGIVAINTWFGTDVPMDAAALISLVLGKAAEYLLPPAVQDIIKRIDNDIVAVAATKPESGVSLEVGAVAAKAAVKEAASNDTFDALMKQMKGGV